MISLTLVDDNVFFRQVLKTHLSVCSDVQMMFDSANGQDLLNELADCAPSALPDIILLDLNMPVLDGRKTAKIIREKYPFIKIVMISLHFNKHVVSELLKCGVRGFIKKSIEAKELEVVINTVAHDQIYMGQGLFKSVPTFTFKKFFQERRSNHRWLGIF